MTATRAVQGLPPDPRRAALVTITGTTVAAVRNSTTAELERIRAAMLTLTVG